MKDKVGGLKRDLILIIYFINRLVRVQNIRSIGIHCMNEELGRHRGGKLRRNVLFMGMHVRV